MPFATGAQARINTNIQAENAYNSLDAASKNISLRQLRLSTGKKINNAADDVAGYITVRALQARNGTLKAAIKTVSDALNVTSILQDALDNINGLVTLIKEAASSAASGAMGTDEKVALAKSAYRMAQQIQTVVDSTVFGGRQLLDSTFYGDFNIGSNAAHHLLTISIDMTSSNPDFNVPSNNFIVNSIGNGHFAGVSNLNLEALNNVSDSDLGIFSISMMNLTLASLSTALNNANKVAAYLGGIQNRLQSQEELLKGQIVNYNAAISRLEDADVAQEQLELIKAQFLQQASLISLAQANQNGASYLNLLRG
ncbi:MAG: flagellin [Candidatus Kapabacteria bacterium]|nr:flagellin [Candidatus Kapabacteria bacterium]